MELKDSCGKTTALMLASSKGYTEIVNLLFVPLPPYTFFHRENSLY